MLKDIPEIININTSSFKLIGVIAYDHPMGGSSIGHYKSFCRRVGGKWELCDGLKKAITNAKTIVAIETHVLVYGSIEASTSCSSTTCKL